MSTLCFHLFVWRDHFFPVTAMKDQKGRPPPKDKSQSNVFVPLELYSDRILMCHRWHRIPNRITCRCLLYVFKSPMSPSNQQRAKNTHQCKVFTPEWNMPVCRASSPCLLQLRHTTQSKAMQDLFISHHCCQISSV